MLTTTQIAIPTLVRMKPGAMDRIGVYAARGGFRHPVLFVNRELDRVFIDRVRSSLSAEGIVVLKEIEISEAGFDVADEVFHALPRQRDLLIGLGGGKALDVAKYVAFLSRTAYIAMPTSLSNDSFCSPQVSLTLKGVKKSYPAAMPYGVVVDTEVCMKAPVMLWWSGVGDLISKFTAVRDWKLAHKKAGTQVNDLAALLSDSTVFQFIAHSTRDLEGVRLLAMALMLNGIAMEIAGSSRPASGSEHLISHALDMVSARPRLHGLQVGIATYLVSQVQGREKTERITDLFDRTGFWDAFRTEPLDLGEWIEAVRLAPTIKEDFYTVLSDPERVEELINILDHDPRLAAIFTRR